MSHTRYDALIVGAGPAGLSAALALCRLNRTSAVFSNGQFRNHGVQAMHYVPSRDGESPVEFRGTTREQILRYGVTDFFDARIVEMSKKSFDGYSGFEITDQDGKTWTGRKLILALGNKDIAPQIKGYEENWPNNIYQCLLCDGHERRHLPKGILTFPSPLYMHFALQQVSLTSNDSKIYVFSDGPFPKTEDLQVARRTLIASGCIIEERRIERLKPTTNGLNVVLQDGEEIFVGFLSHKPDCELIGEDMFRALGLEVEDALFGRIIKTEEYTRKTNVRGVFAAGDSVTPLKSVTNAIASGVNAATAALNELVTEDGERSLAMFEQTAAQNGSADPASKCIS